MAETQTEPDIRLEMFSHPRLLAAARALVGNVAQRLGFNEVECGQISLAADEALCNIINHGYDRRSDGRIWMSIWALNTDRPGIKIVLEDLARQVDPSTIQSRDLNDVRPGGLGVFIIREIMDVVEYEPRPSGGMQLTMVKHQPEPETDPRAGAEPVSGGSGESEANRG
jgi:anti-sigma regulatory factor (Ser/Thr protein kinase)